MPVDVVPSNALAVHEPADVCTPSQLRHLWHSLWSRTPRASFRQTPEFLEANTLQDDRSDSRWRFLVVTAWQRPLGIVPLREQIVRRAFGSFRKLSFSTSPWGDCPGPIGPQPATILSASVQHLLSNDTSWDILEFPEVVTNDLSPSLTSHLSESFVVSIPRSPRELLGLKLPATFGQFWADRDAVARNRWRELEARRTMHRDDEQFVRFCPKGTLFGETDRSWHLFDHLERIVDAQEGTTHARRSRELLERLRDMHTQAVDAGVADIAIWFSDTRPAAFAYNFHGRTRVETALLLADPSVPSATDRLLGQMLRDEIRRGDSWHQFLPDSVLGTNVDRTLWQPTEQFELAATHTRRQSLCSRLHRWLTDDSRTTRQVVRQSLNRMPSNVEA